LGFTDGWLTPKIEKTLSQGTLQEAMFTGHKRRS
jgi:hypothetical protein